MSRHIGFPGERRKFAVMVQKVTIREHAFGQNAEHTLITPEGDILFWDASGHGKWLVEGEAYSVKATIRTHRENDGIKQTVVSHLCEYEEPVRVPRVAIGLSRGGGRRR